MKTDFPVLWPLLSFPNCWHIKCNTFTALSFRIWNSSAGISPLRSQQKWDFLRKAIWLSFLMQYPLHFVLDSHFFFFAYRYYLTEKFNYIFIIKFYFILFIRILFWLRARTCQACALYTPGVKIKLVSLTWKTTISLIGIISFINIWWCFLYYFRKHYIYIIKIYME